MKASDYKISPYGENAILIQFKNEISQEIHRQVVSTYKGILEANLTEVVSLVPGYSSLVVKTKSSVLNNSFISLIDELIKSSYVTDNHDVKTVNIPVCYDPELALDIAEVMKYTGLTIEEIIDIHTASDYLVYMLGFTPGFPYLGGMDERLITPRKLVPRTKIPSGAVGIANQQTGVYPSSSPGGWQIIGQTPLSLFEPNGTFPISIGDTVRFNSISLEEFKQVKNEG